MKLPIKIHQEDARQALKRGSLEAVMGHLLAAQSVASQEGELPSISSLTAEAFRTLHVPPLEQDRVGHIANLAQKAMLTGDVADLKALAQVLIDLEEYALLKDVFASFPDLDDDEGVAALKLKLETTQGMAKSGVST
jgi:hypothetical protein